MGEERSPDADVRFLDGGHSALENNLDDIASAILKNDMTPSIVVSLALLISVVSLSSAQSQTALPAPSASIDTTILSIPLFARLAADGGSLHAYSVPVRVTARIHKFLFSFRFSQNGEVAFEEPEHLSISIRSVPKRYESVFAQLGTPSTWPMLYDLRLRNRVLVDGKDTYELTGVPRESSEVDQIVIRTSDENGPVDVQWVLQGGWKVTGTIELGSAGDYLVPKQENVNIGGNGFRIQCELLYGDYTVNGEIAATTAVR